MLFQVTLLAIFVAQPLLPAVTLKPQVEADDDEHAKEKLALWLEKTGYVAAPNTEPEFKALDDSGLPPEVAAVNALVNENADLKQQLADVGSDEAETKLAALQRSFDDQATSLKQSDTQLATALSEREDYKQKASDLGAMLQKEAQLVADKDSEIATLKAQLEEALKPAVVNPPVANPTAPAASPVAPADGTTPAT